MTAPTDLAAWLDGLDEARKAATPGSWEVLGDEGIWASLVFGGTFVTLGDGVDPADAAAIVAAVNALPELVAAVRGVLALAEELERLPHTKSPHVSRVTVARSLRAVVAAAHTEEGR